jgi:hypothetical protein
VEWGAIKDDRFKQKSSIPCQESRLEIRTWVLGKPVIIDHSAHKACTRDTQSESVIDQPTAPDAGKPGILVEDLSVFQSNCPVTAVGDRPIIIKQGLNVLVTIVLCGQGDTHDRSHKQKNGLSHLIGFYVILKCTVKDDVAEGKVA